MANEKLDLIERGALLRRFFWRREDFTSAWRTFEGMPDEAKIQYHEMLASAIIVEDFPTVDAVEVVHGHWEWDTEDVYKCSNCAGKSHVKEVMGQPDWDYCPNCGAKMDGGNEDG